LLGGKRVQHHAGPAGASVQKHTVLNNFLSDNNLDGRNASARIMYVILVARSEAFLGQKSIRKLMQEIKIRLRDQPRVF
jgi:hypothetical protein